MSIWDSTFGTGSGSAAQGPLAGGIGAAGIGLDIFGTLKAAQTSSQESQVSQEVAGVEMQQNALRQQAMTLDASHRRVQIAQQTQLAMAQGKAAAVASGAGIMGANASSAYKGGQGQAAARGAYNTLGVNQEEQLGNQMFGLTNQIDQYKIQMAQLQGQGATDQGIASIGGGILGGAANIAKLAVSI